MLKNVALELPVPTRATLARVNLLALKASAPEPVTVVSSFSIPFILV